MFSNHNSVYHNHFDIPSKLDIIQSLLMALRHDILSDNFYNRLESIYYLRYVRVINIFLITQLSKNSSVSTQIGASTDHNDKLQAEMLKN